MASVKKKHFGFSNFPVLCPIGNFRACNIFFLLQKRVRHLFRKYLKGCITLNVHKKNHLENFSVLWSIGNFSDFFFLNFHYREIREKYVWKKMCPQIMATAYIVYLLSPPIYVYINYKIFSCPTISHVSS